MRQALMREQALIFVFDPYDRCACARNHWAPIGGAGRRGLRFGEPVHLIIWRI